MEFQFGIAKLYDTIVQQSEVQQPEPESLVEIPVKSRYDSYVEYLEMRGWRREQITIDELNTNIVTLQSVDAGTTGWAIDIKSPANHKISIQGTNQISGGADARSAHSLRVRFSDSSENELAFNTKIRITKEKPSEAVLSLARVFYADINNTKQPGLENSATTQYKTDPEWYRFKQGIEINGEQRLRIYIINTLGTTAQPEIAHDVLAPNISLALDCDLWSENYGW